MVKGHSPKVTLVGFSLAVMVLAKALTQLAPLKALVSGVGTRHSEPRGQFGRGVFVVGNTGFRKKGV